MGFCDLYFEWIDDSYDEWLLCFQRCISFFFCICNVYRYGFLFVLKASKVKIVNISCIHEWFSFVYTWFSMFDMSLEVAWPLVIYWCQYFRQLMSLALGIVITLTQCYLNDQGHNENLAKTRINGHHSILRCRIWIIFNIVVLHDQCACLVINERSNLNGQDDSAVVAKIHVRP